MNRKLAWLMVFVIAVAVLAIVLTPVSSLRLSSRKRRA